MDFSTYLNSMFDRRDQSRLVDFVDVAFRDGTKPVISRCHANVDRWVHENPTHESVRGWLFIGGDEHRGLFGSHSVVRLPDRPLVDITPVVAGQPRMPFLPHLGTLESYEPFLEPRFAYFTWPQGWAAAAELCG